MNRSSLCLFSIGKNLGLHRVLCLYVVLWVHFPSRKHMSVTHIRRSGLCYVVTTLFVTSILATLTMESPLPLMRTCQRDDGNSWPPFFAVSIEQVQTYGHVPLATRIYLQYSLRWKFCIKTAVKISMCSSLLLILSPRTRRHSPSALQRFISDLKLSPVVYAVPCSRARALFNNTNNSTTPSSWFLMVSKMSLPVVIIATLLNTLSSWETLYSRAWTNSERQLRPSTTWTKQASRMTSSERLLRMCWAAEHNLDRTMLDGTGTVLILHNCSALQPSKTAPHELKTYTQSKETITSAAGYAPRPCSTQCMTESASPPNSLLSARRGH